MKRKQKFYLKIKAKEENAELRSIADQYKMLCQTPSDLKVKEAAPEEEKPVRTLDALKEELSRSAKVSLKKADVVDEDGFLRPPSMKKPERKSLRLASVRKMAGERKSAPPML